MRHRKKLFAATVLLGAAFAAWFFWPHSNPQARQALAQLRELVEIDDGGTALQATEAIPRKDVQVELRIVLIAITMTDAPAGLFAEPGRVNAKTTVGHVKSLAQFLETVKSSAALRIVGMPVTTLVLGQQSIMEMGGEVPIVTPAPPGGVAASVRYQAFGTRVSTEARPGASGGIILDVCAELSRLTGMKTTSTPQGPMQVPKIEAQSAKGRLELKDDEALIIGGVSNKMPDTTEVRLPLLSELPGIGAWVCWRRQREIERELVIVVTPRIVAQIAAK